MIKVPFGLIFQASCAITAGIGAIGYGYIDIGSLLVLVFTRLLLSYDYFSHSPAESEAAREEKESQGTPLKPWQGGPAPLQLTPKGHPTPRQGALQEPWLPVRETGFSLLNSYL